MAMAARPLARYCMSKFSRMRYITTVTSIRQKESRLVQYSL